MKNLSIFSFVIMIMFGCTDNNDHENNLIEGSPQPKINIFYDKAFEYSDASKMDSAFLFFNEAKDLFLLQRDSLAAAKCLVQMGIISTNNADYFGGQELSLIAASYLNIHKKDHWIYIRSNLNNLGIASYNLENYSQAIGFYTQSLNFANDSLSFKVIENNIANAYATSGEYNKSIAIYDRILNRGVDDSLMYAKVLTNRTTAKWRQNNSYKASLYFLKALQIREKKRDYPGMHSSYGHLSDYYATDQQSLARFYAIKMYQIALKMRNADDQLMALKKLVKLSPPEETKQYFDTYQDLDDSVQTAHSLAKNQFALIRYETEKHKTNNFKLQKDNAEHKYQLIKQKVLLASTLFFAVMVLGSGFILYRRRKDRVESEAKNSIRENQLRTSKKVHDVIANGLYRVIAEMENQQSLNKENVLDRLEEMYEKSRNLSYDEIQYNHHNFHEKVSSILISFANESTKVVYLGNSANLWNAVSVGVKYEVEHILQELMVNMKKHSGATSVGIKFEQVGNFINVVYADNGVGSKADLTFKNGLTNTGNRINSIKGSLTFDIKVEKGLKIQFSFPIS